MLDLRNDLVDVDARLDDVEIGRLDDLGALVDVAGIGRASGGRRLGRGSRCGGRGRVAKLLLLRLRRRWSCCDGGGQQQGWWWWVGRSCDGLVHGGRGGGLKLFDEFLLPNESRGLSKIEENAQHLGEDLPCCGS